MHGTITQFTAAFVRELADARDRLGGDDLPAFERR